MALLKVDDDGYLPESALPQSVSFADIYDTFVDGAPHPNARDRLYRALGLQTELLAEVFGPARLWIGGLFVSRAAKEPTSVELVYICKDMPHFLRNLKKSRFERVLSVLSVIIGSPRLTGVNEMHPVGGLLNTVQARPEMLELEYARLSRAATNNERPVGFIQVDL